MPAARLDCGEGTGRGTLPWKRLLDPAIKAADEGFIISEGSDLYSLSSEIGAEFGTFSDDAKAIYGRDGIPLRAGDRRVQKDLAHSLRLIAEQGAEAIHSGELARAIDATVHDAGGFLTLEDLRNSRAEWWTPAHIDYRGYDVWAGSAPASGWNGLERLGILGRFDVAALGHNSTAYLHLYAEVTKLACADRRRYAGDPDASPPPLGRTELTALGHNLRDSFGQTSSGLPRFEGVALGY